MAISSRMAGAIVDCPTCGEKTLVPQAVDSSAEPAPLPSAAEPDDSDQQAETSPEEQSANSGFEPLPSDIDEQDRGDQHGMLEIPISPVESRDVGAAPTQGTVPHDEERFIPAELEDDDDGTLVLRRHRTLDEEMDLTPMVDVTFQLLIFFMVSASFSVQKSIEIPTPDPEQKGAAHQVQTMEDIQGTSLLVKIDASNSIWIDEELVPDPARLVDTMRDKMRREQKTEILVTAHSQALHRAVISVIDAANEIGVQRIRMTSHKPVD